MLEKGHVYDMMGRDAKFYRDLFSSLDNNAVLRKRNEQGVFVPVSCTREFTQMMECTAEEFLEAETKEPLCTVLPEDREDTAYLLEHGIARNGQNHVTVRKRTMKGSIIWVDLHDSVFTSSGVQYA